jgi:hypothetical protein
MERYAAALPTLPNPQDSYSEILRMSGNFDAAEHCLKIATTSATRSLLRKLYDGNWRRWPVATRTSVIHGLVSWRRRGIADGPPEGPRRDRHLEEDRPDNPYSRGTAGAGIFKERLRQ